MMKHVTPGELRISTGDLDLPFEVRDMKFRLVSRGIGSETHEVSPGTYLVTAKLPGQQTLMATVEAAEGAAVDVVLAPGDEGRAGPRAYLPPGGALERLGAEPEGDVVPQAPRWSLRFYRAVEGLRFEPVSGDVRHKVLESGEDVARIVLSAERPGAYLAQAAIEDQVPLNLALPLGPYAGECELTARAVGPDIIFGAYPRAPHSQLAARFLAAGDVREGTQVIGPGEAELMLQSKMADPIGAAIGAYLLLRSGDVERLHDWPRNLADWFDWLPDGAIIAAEASARDGRYDEALALLSTAVSRGLPIFTDGYSILVSRLRQLARVEKAEAAPHSPGTQRHPDPGGGDRELVPQRAEAGAQLLLGHVLDWSPFIDYGAPTVTFRASDPGDPADTQHPSAASEPPEMEFEGTVARELAVA